MSNASLQNRLDKAIEVNSFGIIPSEDETAHMAELPDDVLATAHQTI